MKADRQTVFKSYITPSIIALVFALFVLLVVLAAAFASFRVEGTVEIVGLVFVALFVIASFRVLCEIVACVFDIRGAILEQTTAVTERLEAIARKEGPWTKEDL